MDIASIIAGAVKTACEKHHDIEWEDIIGATVTVVIASGVPVETVARELIRFGSILAEQS